MFANDGEAFEQKGRMILGRGGNFRGLKPGMPSGQWRPRGLTP